MRLANDATLPQVERAIKKYVNQCEGRDYRSGASVMQFSSRGFRYRSWSHKAQRAILCFSKGEYEVNLRTEFHDCYLETRDQWLHLPLDRSIEIASHLRVRHPQVRQVLRPVSTDFLVTCARRIFRAIEVKYSPEYFDHPRKGRNRIDRIALQRELHASEGQTFDVVFRSDLNREVSKNLRLLKSRVIPSSPQVDRMVGNAAEVSSKAWRVRSGRSLGSIVQIVGERLGVNEDRSLRLVYSALWTSKLAVDMRTLILLDDPLVSTDHPTNGVELPC